MELKEYIKLSAQAIIIILLIFICTKVDNINKSVDLFDFDKSAYCD